MLLAGAAAWGAFDGDVFDKDAHAMGRVPLGGSITMRIPWAVNRLDPHDLFDPVAAFFGHAVCDTVFALDSGGNAYPTLADGWPTEEDGQTVVRLRPGLRSAAGKAIGGRDLAWSVKRARDRGAVGVMAQVDPFVRSDASDPLVARFGKIAPARLAQLLASPLLSIVPVGFSPTAPDGTGAFKATLAGGRLLLERNLAAPRGPSFLDKVTVHSTADLADSLRAFEGGRDDIGWQGLGFHRDRQGARRFSFGTVAWVVLATGNGAPAGLRAPGVAQQLANAVPVERLHLGLAPRTGVGASATWTGGPADLLFDRGSGQLAGIAAALAAKLSRAGDEVTARGVSRGALRVARQSGNFTLALDVVRDPQAGPASALIALSTADRRRLGEDVGKRPPRGSRGPANRLTATLRLGILGGLAVQGGVASGITLLSQRSGRGLDLGATYGPR